MPERGSLQSGRNFLYRHSVRTNFHHPLVAHGDHEQLADWLGATHVFPDLLDESGPGHVQPLRPVSAPMVYGGSKSAASALVIPQRIRIFAEKELRHLQMAAPTIAPSLRTTGTNHLVRRRKRQGLRFRLANC
ncbi:hypothetical protein [Pseudoxanthomonas putridarboris]|uniref:hypothetical protein n=1 Tax=Pseudoxanthomonas putridarboris TaxID=752605 RepID=UPI00311EFDEB